MKRWLALFMLLLVLLPGCAPEEKTPCWRLVEQCFYVDGVPDRTMQYTYDAQGRRTSWNWCDGEGNVVHAERYTYEKEGRRTWRIQETDVDGVWTEVAKWLLDENENLLEIWENYQDKGWYLSQAYNYDENGNRIFSRSYMPDGEPAQTTCWEYDEHGNVTREYSYTGEDETDLDWDHWTFYTYDEAGRMTESTFCQSEDLKPVTTVYTYTFHEDGTVAQQVGVSSVFNTHYVMEYDESGNRILQGVYKATGRMIEETVWEYDEHGNAVVEEKQTDDDVTRRTEMVYESY